jgi:RNA polymerase sigma factor (sigma-70 family)
MDESLQQWFIREILVHERALLRFLARAWPDRAEIDDLCHETYIRVYESAAKALPVSPRGFLFAIARHLMADRVRRSRIVSIEMRGDLDSLNNVLIDDISPEQRLDARQDLWRLTLAFGSLPQTCREVMWLIKVEELTRREIAERLNLTPKAVEKRIERGVRLLAEAYFGGKDLDVQTEGSAIETNAEIEDRPHHG